MIALPGHALAHGLHLSACSRTTSFPLFLPILHNSALRDHGHLSPPYSSAANALADSGAFSHVSALACCTCAARRISLFKSPIARHTSRNHSKDSRAEEHWVSRVTPTYRRCTFVGDRHQQLSLIESFTRFTHCTLQSIRARCL